MIDKICIITPTRERLEDFQIFANSWKKTTDGNSIIVVGIDDDDDTYDSIIKNNEYPFIYERVKSKPFLHILNELAVKYAKEYNYIAFIEDDVRFITTNWDLRLINKLKELGKNGMVWCNDLISGRKVIGQPCISSSIIRRLGYMSLPNFNTQLADAYWTELSWKIKSAYYFDDIIIEHRHYSTGKRPKGKTSWKVQIDSIGDNDYKESRKFKKALKRDAKKLLRNK